MLEVAGRCPAVDVGTLAKALDEGRARRVVMDDAEHAKGKGVSGSPHVVLADGSEWFNPGMEIDWHDGELVVRRDDPGVYEGILRRAVG